MAGTAGSEAVCCAGCAEEGLDVDEEVEVVDCELLESVSATRAGGGLDDDRSSVGNVSGTRSGGVVEVGSMNGLVEVWSLRPRFLRPSTVMLDVESKFRTWVKCHNVPRQRMEMMRNTLSRRSRSILTADRGTCADASSRSRAHFPRKHGAKVDLTQFNRVRESIYTLHKARSESIREP